MDISDGPEYLCRNTFEVAKKLDENQFDSLIERYCLSHYGPANAKKYFGFELDKITLEWLKENRPIFEFLE